MKPKIMFKMTHSMNMIIMIMLKTPILTHVTRKDIIKHTDSSMIIYVLINLLDLISIYYINVKVKTAKKY